MKKIYVVLMLVCLLLFSAINVPAGTAWSNHDPVNSTPSPSNAEGDISPPPSNFSIRISDKDDGNQTVNVTFRGLVNGSWHTLQTNSTVATTNDTFFCLNTSWIMNNSQVLPLIQLWMSLTFMLIIILQIWIPSQTKVPTGSKVTVSGGCWGRIRQKGLSCGRLSSRWRSVAEEDAWSRSGLREAETATASGCVSQGRSGWPPKDSAPRGYSPTTTPGWAS